VGDQARLTLITQKVPKGHFLSLCFGRCEGDGQHDYIIPEKIDSRQEMARLQGSVGVCTENEDIPILEGRNQAARLKQAAHCLTGRCWRVRTIRHLQ
jgi:hypothetical protein